MKHNNEILKQITSQNITKANDFKKDACIVADALDVEVKEKKSNWSDKRKDKWWKRGMESVLDMLSKDISSLDRKENVRL